MINFHTRKSRFLKIRQTLSKYAQPLKNHTVRLYFGDIETGKLSSKPKLTGVIRTQSTNKAAFKFTITSLTEYPVPFNNEEVVMIKDLTLNLFVYRNPSIVKGQINLY